MNYLAHAWLSGPDPDWRLGGFLGDHVRGRDWEGYPSAVAEGILLHRRVDAFVDAHPAMARARRRLQPPFRRYAGILIDVYFDHLLARRWSRLAGGSLRRFADEQYLLLRTAAPGLPDSLNRFARHMERHDLLMNYRDPLTLERALAGIGSRLSRSNPLHRGREALDAEVGPLSEDFESLWPAVSGYAERLRRRPGRLYRPADQAKSITSGS